MIDYYRVKGNYQKELELSTSAYKNWPANYDLGLTYARSLLNNKQYAKCISLMKKLNVLPFEGAGASRAIYEKAYLGEALRVIEKAQYKKAIVLLEEAKLWPENLGVGRPFSPDQRKIDFLQGVCYQELGQASNKEVSSEALQQYTLKYFERRSLC